MTVASGAMMNQGRGGAAMAMSGIGTALMTYGGPVGFVVGGLMTIASMFMGKKKSDVKESSTWKPEEVRSMAPYMGMDIAPVPQMYALEKSRFFGRSGPIQVNINIDKISGADETIAETISKKYQLV